MRNLSYVLIGAFVLFTIICLYVIFNDILIEGYIKDGGFYRKGIHYRVYEVENE